MGQIEWLTAVWAENNIQYNIETNNKQMRKQGRDVRKRSPNTDSDCDKHTQSEILAYINLGA